LLLASVYVLFQIRQTLSTFFIAIILMGALNPAVDRLEKHKIPRALAILLIYFLLLFFFAIIIVGIIPRFIEQSSALASSLPTLFEHTNVFGLTPQYISSQFQIFDNLPREAVKLVLSVFQNLLSVLVIFVITFYLLIEHKNLNRYSFFLFGQKSKQKALGIISLLEKRLGDWVRAQAFLMIIVGGLSYLGFAFLRLEYAVPLAILAGLLELVPNIGPTLATVPAVLAGLTVSPLTGLAALAWSFLVQQLENNLIVPKIMKKAVGINPLVTILCLIIGFKLGGVMGGVLAIPIYLTLEVIITGIYTQELQKKSL
jgi:predicted PurR-regulated permease PerM